MTLRARLFTSAATTLQAAEESLVATLDLLRVELTEQGTSANEVALELGVSLDFATRLLEGSAVPEELAAWRATEVTRLVQDVYQDLDSYRSGLLCCRAQDPVTLMISATHPADEYRRRYETRAETLGMTVYWPQTTLSLFDVKDHLAELDRQAAVTHVDPPAGRIDDTDLTVAAESVAMQDWIGNHLGQWIRTGQSLENS
ncbi:XRE family transcriptional regulator [Acidipropionibacterium jensenii]|uniref:XRE family transcriptional regulator n=1 Tax=Acidipropionibacterium jensenii TaxID=1749 RepID=UPI000BC343D7|nr:XRE family transcriptional regulator [Acidipropionibacterium jensenii]AZZ42397.1 XRE family transcriptional regulator [Acidipropionibacterium jensenii]QCV88632.1 XRE family transcriptional regulator [Acidipropionibacterium jensenii]